ncbi:TPA: hypothetical protein N0F65_012583 [Lagenidium giganteum]|uniref:Uncharacterized protein n=1 Tax=Lagenidium giganteum TaxID=4803 RepID=A0AAV2YR56_9STRA|nr:TPA: hypothetical protein N0F65_012583 [Lagenidium giganteum]
MQFRVSMTLLPSHEDVQHNMGGLSHMSRRKVDVAAIMCVRDCFGGGIDDGEGGCQTVYIDDSRYENAVFGTGATEWYAVVATLRVFAQGYFCLRIVMFLYGCYCTRASEDIYKNRSVMQNYVRPGICLCAFPVHLLFTAVRSQ